MPRGWLHALLAGVLLAVMLVGAGAAQSTLVRRSLTLHPDAGPPGTRVTISGSGAPPRAEVVILGGNTINPPTICETLAIEVPRVARARADAAGRFSLQHVAAAEPGALPGARVFYLAKVILSPSRELVSPTRCFSFTRVSGRAFPETQYRVEHDAFWSYFLARGGVGSFGFPISRTFQFLGCTTQFFQRQLLQECGTDAPGSLPVRTMNLLDPDLLAYDQINFSRFPAHDPAVASAAPDAQTSNLAVAQLAHIRSVAPDEFQGLPVRFSSTFVTTVPGVDPAIEPVWMVQVNLELWGLPTSRPAFDPSNRNFVYQRFQRGIMHYDHTMGVTRGILLADWFKSLLTGQGLPPDLAAQAQGSRFLRQYCPDQPQWLCRPSELPGTDLSFAFERQ